MRAYSITRLAVFFAIGALLLDLSYCSANSADWRGCADDLNEVRRAAGDALDAAEKLAATKDELHPPALSNLKSNLDSLERHLRSVQGSCEFRFSLDSSSRLRSDQETTLLPAEELRELIQDPWFQQATAQWQIDRVSEFMAWRTPIFLELPFDRRRVLASEAIEQHTRAMLNPVKDVLQVDYQPNETVIDKLGWIKAKQRLKEILSRAVGPQIDIGVMDITYNHFRYRVKTTMKECSVSYSSVDRVEIFDNHIVFIRGGHATREGVIVQVVFGNQKDAKLFADLVMSFRRQYIHSKK